MKEENLIIYIRNRVWNKFVNLVKKDRCEICGSTEDLQVHHIYPLTNMIKDTLEELNLERKCVNEYTKLELKNIKEKVLGKHLYYQYKTLCKDCHLKGVHKKNKKISEIYEISIDEKYLNKWLTKEAVVNEIIIKNNLKDNKGRIMGLPTLIKNIEKYGFSIDKKKIGKRKITHYMIKKIE